LTHLINKLINKNKFGTIQAAMLKKSILYWSLLLLLLLLLPLLLLLGHIIYKSAGSDKFLLLTFPLHVDLLKMHSISLCDQFFVALLVGKSESVHYARSI